MSEQKLPKCSFCGAKLEEGFEYIHSYGMKSYLCSPCYELLGAFVEDHVAGILKTFMGDEPRLKMKDFQGEKHG